MRKLLAILALLVGTAFAQTVTPNLGMTEPAHGALNWDTQMNGNFNILDNLFTSGSCGLDGVHAMSYNAATKTFGCNPSGVGVPGGSPGNLQYNLAGAFAGFADGSIHQVLHGLRTFSAVTSLDVDTSVALTGVDLNSSSQVTALHLTGPTLCGAGTFARGIDGSGNAAGCTAVAFPVLTGGTNTTAAMLVGTGASLGVSGSGTIDATTLLSKTWAIPASIGSTTPAAGAFTTLSASSQITSSVATGTAPFSITSTTVVPNLNVSQLLGGTWAIPGTIGSTTPNTGAFTTLTVTPGTIVSDIIPISLTWTTNNAGVNFTGLKFAVTNTAQGGTTKNYQFCGGASAANCVTIDPNANLVTPGSATVGAGSSVAGVLALGGGTQAGTTANSFTVSTQGSSSMTAWNANFPASAATGYLYWTNSSNQVNAAFVTGAAGQLPLIGGTVITFPQTSYAPAANCVNAVAGAAWSTGATPVPLCRAGTNNKTGLLSPWGASDIAYIQFHIAADADLTTTLPQLLLELTSTDAVNAHTVIMQEAVACAKEDGSTTDDVAFNAARSFATVTLNGNANRTWKTTLGLNSTDMTGCTAPGIMWVKISRTTDTATNVGAYGLSLTQFRLLVSQAN